MDGYVNKRELIQGLALDNRISFDTRQIVREYIEHAKEVDLSERDTGKEPLLKQGSSLVHSVFADGSGMFDKSKWLEWVCPVCHWFVGELYSGYGRWHVQGETSYCARCGQKIDWTIPREDAKRRYEEYKAKEREQHLKNTGIKLDNMHEGLRQKHGMLNEE